MFVKSVLVRPEELKQMLDHGEVQFVFDLRSQEEFDGWRIEGRTPFETLNIPLEDFEHAEEMHLARLPKNKEIVTVCAQGDVSRRAAERLREMGFNARALEGGMDRWSEFYETRKVNSEPDIYQIYRVAKGCITHVVISGNRAVVIDPVRHIEHIEKILSDTGAQLEHVFETHLQADHISGGPLLAMRHNAHYHISSSDAMEAHYPYISLRNGEEFRIGFSSLVAAFPTPGHTAGSTSLILDGKFIFSGNTIMPSAIGRPALRGMLNLWADLLYGTLHERLDTLPDEMVILPSHAAGIHEQGEDGVVRFTMGEARKRLPLTGIWNRTQFIDCITATLPRNPRRYQDIRKINLGLMDPDEEKRKELETGKNLCGIPDGAFDTGKTLCSMHASSGGYGATNVASRPAKPGTHDLPKKSTSAVNVVEAAEPIGVRAEHLDEAKEEIVLNVFGDDTKTDAAEEQNTVELEEASASETAKTVEEAPVIESSEQATAVGETETVVVVDTAMPESHNELFIQRNTPQTHPKPASPFARPGTAAMQDREEMREMLEELAAERFETMAASIDVKALLLDTLTPTLKESLTRVLWEATPEITEKLLKDVIQNSFRTLNEKLGSVIQESVPELAETIIRRELKKLTARG